MINLLPKEILNRQDYLKKKRGLYLVILVFVGLFFLIELRQQNYLADLNKELVALELKEEELIKVKNQFRQLSLKQEELKDYEELLIYLSPKLRTDQILASINYNLADKLWLEELLIEDGQLLLSGQALNNQAVLKTIDSLNQSQLFKDFSLEELNQDNDLNFKLKGLVKSDD